MKNERQIKFEEEIRRNKCVRLLRTMKMTHASAYRLLNAHMLDGDPIDTEFDGEFTTIKLPSNKLFEKAYGELKVIFKGNSTKTYNLYDIQPRRYFEDCHLGMPIKVHDIMIPNKPQDKFRIELFYQQLINESK